MIPYCSPKIMCFLLSLRWLSVEFMQTWGWFMFWPLLWWVQMPKNGCLFVHIAAVIYFFSCFYFIIPFFKIKQMPFYWHLVLHFNREPNVNLRLKMGWSMKEFLRPMAQRWEEKFNLNHLAAKEIFTFVLFLCTNDIFPLFLRGYVLCVCSVTLSWMLHTGRVLNPMWALAVRTLWRASSSSPQM